MVIVVIACMVITSGKTPIVPNSVGDVQAKYIPNRYCNNHVAPTELEDILQTHPAVAESLVFGIKEPSVQGGNSTYFTNLGPKLGPLH